MNGVKKVADGLGLSPEKVRRRMLLTRRRGGPGGGPGRLTRRQGVGALAAIGAPDTLAAQAIAFVVNNWQKIPLKQISK